MRNARLLRRRTQVATVATVAADRGNVTAIAFDSASARVACAVLRGGSRHDVLCAPLAGGPVVEVARIDDAAPAWFAWLQAPALLVIACSDGSLRAVPARGGAAAWTARLPFPLQDVAASPDAARPSFTEDGRQLVTTTIGGERLAWDLQRFLPQ